MGYIMRKHWFTYFVMTDKKITAIRYSDVFNALIQFVTDKKEFDYLVDMFTEVTEDEKIVKDIMKDFVKDVFKLKETYKKQTLSKYFLNILERFSFDSVFKRDKDGNKYIYLVDDAYKLFLEIKRKIKHFGLEDAGLTYQDFLSVIDLEYDYEYKKYKVIIKDYKQEVNKIFKLLHEIEKYFEERKKQKEKLKESSY